MKKQICFILSVTLLISFAFSLSASLASAEQLIDANGTKPSLSSKNEETVIPAPEISKSEFAAQCREKINNNPAKTTLTEKEEYELIHLYMTSSNPEYYGKLMNDAGLDIYSSTITVSNTRSDADDVSLTNAMIVYSAILGTWTISCNGYWSNLSAISNEIPFIFIPTVGTRKAIGDHDLLAIEFLDVSGTTPHMTDSLLRVHLPNSSEADYIRGPRDYHERYGVVYGYEDYIEITSTSLFGGYSWIYYGKSFDIMVKYDYTFENFYGKARGLYVHTWSSASLNSISFSGSGISFGWTNVQYSFPIRSMSLVEF